MAERTTVLGKFYRQGTGVKLITNEGQEYALVLDGVMQSVLNTREGRYLKIEGEEQGTTINVSGAALLSSGEEMHELLRPLFELESYDTLPPFVRMTAHLIDALTAAQQCIDFNADDPDALDRDPQGAVVDYIAPAIRKSLGIAETSLWEHPELLENIVEDTTKP